MQHWERYHIQIFVPLFHNQDGDITHPTGFLSGAWRMEASKVLSTLLAVAVAVLLFLVTTSI